MQLKMEKITPAVAREMLESNIDRNRAIKERHLERLVADMRDGFWDSNNGETLKFDNEGKLVDGQHRLHAIIQSKSTFTLPVLRGVSSDGFDTLDTGSSRTMGDLLSMRNVPSSTTTAAALVTLEQFYTGNFRTKSLSHRKLLKRYEEHPDLAQFGSVHNAYRSVFRPNEATFLCYLFTAIAPKKGVAFLELIRNGGAAVDHPCHILRENLMRYRMKRDTGYMHVHKEHIIGSVFKCWNHLERKSKAKFEMLKVGEDIIYPIGFKTFFTDIEIGEIRK